nr:ABC transporter ATP-binding protein [Campylobacter sp.]
MSCSVTLSQIGAKIGDKMLFENINLKVGHKEKIVIIGPNGSGKTTLLEIIGGIRQSEFGLVEIFSHKMSNLNDFAKFRSEIGFLFQNSDEQFICPIVYEDVAFGLFARNEAFKKYTEFDEHLLNHHGFEKRQILTKDEIYAKTDEILRNLGIYHIKDKIVFNLSGGEKKLVALAGVLVCEPKIILLDEPTSGLDFDMQKKLAEILANLKVSQIIVSHDKEFIQNAADKIYYLQSNGLKTE